MRLKVLALTVLVLATPNLLAQGSSSVTYIKNEPTAVKNPWTARLDGGAMILGGGGVNVGRGITKNISGEVFFNQTKMKDNDDELSGFEAIHKAHTYGLRLDFFPTVHIDQSGFYLSGTVAHVVLKSEVDPIFSNIKRTLNTDKWGGQGLVGYQIVSTQKAVNLAIRIGGGYGIGGAFTTTLGGSRNSIENSFLFDVSAGAMF